MNANHQKIIDAILQKADAVCPDSLALLGLYGSAATGDTHEKSDLDLLILIHDEQGRQLADGFILQDTGIGYDMYCTTWEMLEADAQCSHAHLSKLMDAKLICVKDQNAVLRLEALRKQAADLLASDARFDKARDALNNAKKSYAHCFLTDSLPEIRIGAGDVIYFLLNAVMLYNGKYFRRGVKRTFAELEALRLPFDMEKKILRVIRGETADQIRDGLTDLVRTVQAYLTVPQEREMPSPENLAGAYEEMVSNWRNKMKEAADRDDLFSSFVNMAAFQSMLSDIAQSVAVDVGNVMEHFDPRCLENNRQAFDDTLEAYLEICQQAGIRPKVYADADDFAAHYTTAE